MISPFPGLRFLIYGYLPMSTKRAHLDENLKALNLEISPEDNLALDHIELSEDRLWPV